MESLIKVGLVVIFPDSVHFQKFRSELEKIIKIQTNNIVLYKLLTSGCGYLIE